MGVAISDRLPQSVREQEQVFIARVIERLTKDPLRWTARWFGSNLLCKSIRYGEILIMHETGDIVHPITPSMTSAQKKLVKALAKTIVERDREQMQKEKFPLQFDF